MLALGHCRYYQRAGSGTTLCGHFLTRNFALPRSRYLNVPPARILGENGERPDDLPTHVQANASSKAARMVSHSARLLVHEEPHLP
jgi:hypothetical protein